MSPTTMAPVLAPASSPGLRAPDGQNDVGVLDCLSAAVIVLAPASCQGLIRNERACPCPRLDRHARRLACDRLRTLSGLIGDPLLPGSFLCQHADFHVAARPRKRWPRR